jgi:hypothetical protein
MNDEKEKGRTSGPAFSHNALENFSAPTRS